MTTKEEKRRLEDTHESLLDTIQELENMEFKANDAHQVFVALDSLRKAEDQLEMLLLRFD